MKSAALLLFFKYPQHGKVKTRIAASMGDDFALGLYSSFARDIILLSASIKAEKIIACDGPPNKPLDSMDFATGYRVIRQTGTDIGVRMHNAFMTIFNEGYERAVLIGGDCPDMPAEFIQLGLNSLQHEDIVLGKTMDGGFYLIGFNQKTCLPEYFTGIKWSTSTVFQQTVEKISQTGKKAFLLPEWSDIDTINDLKRFFLAHRETPTTAPHTMKYLQDTGLCNN